MTENDTHLTDASLDGKSFVFRKSGEWKVPTAGDFQFNMVAVDIAEDRVTAEDFERLTSSLLRIKNPMERLSQLGDLIQHQRISCHQAPHILSNHVRTLTLSLV